MSASTPSSAPSGPVPPGRRPRSPLFVALCTSLWLATVGNVALWRALAELPGMPSGTSSVLGPALALGVMIACLLMLLMAPFAWRGTLKPVATALLLMAAAGAHFMLLYRVVINPEMMVNVLQTDVRESRDLLNLRLLLTLLIIGIVPAALLWRTPLARGRSLGRRALHNLAAAAAALALLLLVLLASYQSMAGLMRTHKSLRYLINPLNSIYALVDVGLVRPFVRPMPFEVVGQDAQLAPAVPGDRPPLLLLVVGETARAGNFSLNGYARNTNPLLARQPGLVSFSNVWSCGTSTAASLPCMFSPLDKHAFESRRANTSSLLDVLQQAGLAVLWVNNQSGCKGVCDRIPHLHSNQAAASHYQGDASICHAPGECLDEVMLRGLDGHIASLPAPARARGVVVVLHQMGSHGPAYYRRSDAASKHFQPECTTNVLQECARETLVNAYDNSIVYTDRFLNMGIEWLRTHAHDHRTAMLYVSDHGESLGENNLYLHGLPYGIAPDVQKRVPLLWWFSPEWQQQGGGVALDCLANQRDARYSHDNLFHSVLGALGVQTSLYQAQLDMLAACRGAPGGK